MGRTLYPPASKTLASLIASLLTWSLASPLLSEAYGQLAAEQREALAENIQQAKQQLDASKLPELNASQAQVLENFEALQQYLRQNTSEENRQAWLDYLNAEPLLEAIRQDAPPAQQGRLARDLQFRMTRNFAGLDMRSMRRLRRSLRQLQSAVRFRRPERTIEQLQQQLDRLAQRVREMDDVPSADDAAAVSVVLELLEAAGQEEAMAPIVRSRFSHPNIRLMIGEGLVQQFASRPINRTQPVNDCILGTRIRGQATLHGAVQAQLIPSYDTIRIQLSMHGNFAARNVGYNGPVTVNTVANGNVSATRTLLVSEQGISLEPTYAQANLNSNITNINHHLKLVRKIAARRAAEQKPKAEQISVRKLQQQVGSEFDRETSQYAGRSLDLPLEDLERVFGRLDVSVPSRQLYASEEFIYVDMRQAEEDQVLALNAPPGLTPDMFIGAQFHESAIDNVASRVLAGRTMTRKQLESLLGNLQPKDGATRPEPFIVPAASEDAAGDAADVPEDADEPFEIDFASFRPLIFEARDDTVRVGVRGTRFSQGGRELDRAVEITAVYRPTYFQDKIYLLRQGDVEVNYPGRGRLSVSQVAIRRNIQIAFRDAFPKAILNRPVKIPRQQSSDMLVYPRSITARDGWLSVGLR